MLKQVISPKREFIESELFTKPFIAYVDSQGLMGDTPFRQIMNYKQLRTYKRFPANKVQRTQLLNQVVDSIAAVDDPYDRARDAEQLLSRKRLFLTEAHVAFPMCQSCKPQKTSNHFLTQGLPFLFSPNQSGACGAQAPSASMAVATPMF